MNVTMETFGYPETLIKEYQHWVVLLRPKQVTIGSLVLVAKEDVVRLGELNKAAWSEFAEVCNQAEGLLKDVFKADKFNYLALMMKDPNVHFHFIPRYSTPVSLEGVEYPDSDWPMKTEMQPLELGEEVWQIILDKLLKAA